MKILFAFLLAITAQFASATEICTAAITDRYGYEYEQHTRSSYSQESACSDALWSCRQSLSNARANGRYYDADCFIVTRPQEGPMNMCTTDLVDYYGGIVRSFSANGRTKQEACAQSDEFCRYELSRSNTYGHRCVRRGAPQKEETANCSARRFDPAGYFIQSYFATYTGPSNMDLKAAACKIAMSNCSRDIKGRQTCRIDR